MKKLVTLLFAIAVFGMAGYTKDPGSQTRSTRCCQIPDAYPCPPVCPKPSKK